MHIAKHYNRYSVRTTSAGTPDQEDCKVKFLTAKDAKSAKSAKSAKEMLARGILQGFFLGDLGVLGGSFCFSDFAVRLNPRYRTEFLAPVAARRNS